MATVLFTRAQAAVLAVIDSQLPIACYVLTQNPAIVVIG